MRNIKSLIILVFILSLYILFSQYLQGSPDYSLQKAKKVLDLIEKIQTEKNTKDWKKLRTVVVTESELNAYIAYRIETEKEEIMKELRLKLFNDNKIEGKIFIDLKKQKIPKIFRPEMTFYAGGRFEVKDSKIRLLIDDLYLEEVPVDPKILNLILYVASKIQNTETSSLTDWYDLPSGIKDIETKHGIAIVYY